jgi:serine/threonine-protein kinase
MAAEIPIDVFFDLLQQSGLASDAQILALKAEFSEEGKKPENSRMLAEELVHRGLLTEWQADMLLQGKHRGFQLGPHRILRPLGQGGMSKVFLAEHEMMHRRCAIKVLPSKYQEDPDLLKRFQHEACAIAALDHPHIVRAYDFNKDVRYGKEIHYLVMEYVEGQDLRRMVESQGPLDYRQAADFMAQAAEGLAHAHKSGFVHRDVKPANLLVDPNGVLKILDLGLARSTFEGERAWESPEEGQSAVGTADYVAPEQVMDSRSVDGRADIYSLGHTFYYLLTGRRPFPKSTLVELLMAHRVEKPEPIMNFRPDVPLELVAIIDRMTAKSPAMRFQTAEEAAESLRSWLRESDSEQYSRISSLMATARRAKQASSEKSEADAKAEADLVLLDTVLDGPDETGDTAKLSGSKKLGSSAKLGGSKKLGSSAKLGNSGKSGSSIDIGALGKSGSSIKRGGATKGDLSNVWKEKEADTPATSGAARTVRPSPSESGKMAALPRAKSDLLLDLLPDQAQALPTVPLHVAYPSNESSLLTSPWLWGGLAAIVSIGALLAAIFAFSSSEKPLERLPAPVVQKPPETFAVNPTVPSLSPTVSQAPAKKEPPNPDKPAVTPQPQPKPQLKPEPQPSIPPKPPAVPSPPPKQAEPKPTIPKVDPEKLLADLTKLSFDFQSSDANLNSPFNLTIARQALEEVKGAELTPTSAEKTSNIMHIQVVVNAETSSVVLSAQMVCQSPGGAVTVWEQSKPIASFARVKNQDLVLTQVRQGAAKFFAAFRVQVQLAKAKSKAE